MCTSPVATSCGKAESSRQRPEALRGPERLPACALRKRGRPHSVRQTCFVGRACGHRHSAARGCVWGVTRQGRETPCAPGEGRFLGRVGSCSTELEAQAQGGSFPHGPSARSCSLPPRSFPKAEWPTRPGPGRRAPGWREPRERGAPVVSGQWGALGAGREAPPHPVASQAHARRSLFRGPLVLMCRTRVPLGAVLGANSL